VVVVTGGKVVVVTGGKVVVVTGGKVVVVTGGKVVVVTGGKVVVGSHTHPETTLLIADFPWPHSLVALTLKICSRLAS
jgi:uncharacterized protein (DUF2345 family)